MLRQILFFSIILRCFAAPSAFASGVGELELRKYLEALRASDSHIEKAMNSDVSPALSRLITLLDQEEPDAKQIGDAIGDIEKSIKPNSPLYILSRYAMSVGYQQSHRYKDAIKLAHQMLGEKVSRDWQYVFYEVIFLASWQIDAYPVITAAFPKYERLFGVARKSERLAVIAYQSYKFQDKEKEAVDILEELARAYPTTEYSRFAFNELMDRSCEGSAEDRYVFSKKLLIQLSRNADLGSGVKEFVLAHLELPMVMEDGDVRQLSDLERTDFLFKTRFYEEALGVLRSQYEVRKNDLNDRDLPDLMYGLARVLMRVQEYKQSALYASKFLSIWNEHPLRNSMKEILADSLRYLNVASTASTLYKELSEPGNSDLFHWQTFWTLYLARRYDEALAVLRAPDAKTTGSRISEDGVLYWEANLLSKLGQTKESDAKYKDLKNRFPNSFYVSYLELSTKDESLAALKPAPNTNSQNDAGVSLVSFEPGAGKKAKAKKDDTEPNRLSDLITFAEDLSDTGRDDLARLFLSDVDTKKVSDWPTYKGLADISFKLGVYKPTRLIRYKKFSPLRQIPDDWLGYQSHIRDNPNHWKVYFPNAYGKVVGHVAETFNRSKFLILSIMRAESFYNHEARSPVGAVGLMQMMPYTAIKIAKLVNDFDFKTSELTKPEFSIGYGAYYIDKLQHYYQENPILAVAAYNAGPKAVNQWIESCRQCSMDEFVESIPYRETRNYVKKVISYFFSYFRVYDEGVPNFQNLNLPEFIPDSKEIF